jgi:hypothetical protein
MKARCPEMTKIVRLDDGNDAKPRSPELNCSVLPHAAERYEKLARLTLEIAHYSFKRALARLLLEWPTVHATSAAHLPRAGAPNFEAR